MDIKNIKVMDASVLACPPDRSPIFYVNLTGKIKAVKARNSITYNVENVVVKGTLEEIKKKDSVKKAFLKRVSDGKSNVNKFVKEFDLSRITITGVEIKKSLGYGIKSD